MSSGKPIIHQIAWISIIPQLLIMAALSALFGIFITPFSSAVYDALICYLLLRLLLRRLVPRNQRKGVRLANSGNYVQAISEFEKSYAFFTKYAWIDTYRFITLLSPSKASYTEMALLNIAFCYTQIGEGNKAKECYEKTLLQFPDSEMAKTSLRVLNSVTTEEP